MSRRFNSLVGLSAVALLATSALSIAQAQDKPPMHMHKSNMNHAKPDAEAAVEFKSEATMLREQAASHRALGENYRARSGGKQNYSQIAKHCDKLAKFYDDAATEADAAASALNAK